MELFFPVLLGTVRRGRESEHVARYVAARLGQRKGISARLFDPRDFPFLDLDAREWEMDPRPAWVDEFVRAMARADGFVIVAPEYNFGYPGTLKNMLDAVYDEWNDKPFALIGCGGVSGGLRMIDQLRQTIPGLGAFTVPLAVPVPQVGKAFGEQGPLAPSEWAPRFDALFVQLERYARALREVRDREKARADAGNETMDSAKS